MRRKVTVAILAIVAFALGMPPAASQTAVEVDGGIPSQGPKLPAPPLGSVQILPEPGELGLPEVTPNPEAVTNTGCFGFFGSRNIRLQARGQVTYRVVPTTFFDVVMRVNYVGLRAFNVDRFGAPGAEQITINGPAAFRNVTVTIRGFLGQAGCFRFTARP